MWTRIKCAWSVLRGNSYAIPYAKVYQNILYDMEGAREIEMSEMYDPTSWDVKPQLNKRSSNHVSHEE